MKRSNLARFIEILLALAIPGIIIIYGNLYLGGIATRVGLIFTGFVGYSLGIILAIWMFKRNKLNILDFGFNTPRNVWKTLLSAIGLFALMTTLYIGIQTLAAVLFAGLIPPVDLSRFDSLVGNNFFLVVTILASWTTIAFSEEIVYRVFLITWFHRMFESSKENEYKLSIVLSAATFGLIHFVEGPVGMITTLTMGILFGWVYIKSNKNIWITIIAHAILNTARFSLIYLGTV